MVIFHSFFVCLPEGNYGGNPPWQSTATVVLQQLGALWLWHRNSAYQDEKHLKIGRVEDPPTRTHKLKPGQVVLSFSKPQTIVKKHTAGSNSRFGIVFFLNCLIREQLILLSSVTLLVKRWWNVGVVHDETVGSYHGSHGASRLGRHGGCAAGSLAPMPGGYPWVSHSL